ncbi:rod shape-determining protein MreC [Patescibacteria group bacterium]
MIETNKQKEVVVLASLIFLSLGLIGLDKLNWLNWIKRPIESISNPINGWIYKKRSEVSIFNKQETDPIILQNKTETLELKNAEFEILLDTLEKENEDMRKLLQAPLSPSWKFIPAKVLGIKNGIMTINQGSDVGVSEGQVVVFENMLIGKVISVNPKLSKIVLPIHKDSKIKAMVLENKGKGVIKSKLGEILVFEEVLQQINLEKNQIIITSGEENIFPVNLIIGKIERIEEEETAIYQKAIIDILIDYISLDNVFIISN